MNGKSNKCDTKKETLGDIAREIIETLETGNSAKTQEANRESLQVLSKDGPVELEADHFLPPYIPKRVWSTLGDCLVEAERFPTTSESAQVPGERWISMRLDGNGFSRMVQKLRHHGVFPRGFSADFASAMQLCTQSLMEKFRAECAYTQSDEITVLISPRSVVRGTRQPHEFNGRVQKMVSIAASHVTARFNFEIAQICREKNIDHTSDMLATFDCRIGSFSSFEEAIGLVLWRAYDCGVNGVSDRVHQLKGTFKDNASAEERSRVSRQGTLAKIDYLRRLGLLPLPDHQAYGSFFCKSWIMKPGFNPKTKQITPPTRRTIITQIPGPVLCLKGYHQVRTRLADSCYQHDGTSMMSEII